MSVHLHQDIPIPCTPVAKGTLLRLFNAKCTYKLHTYPSPPDPDLIDPVIKKLPRSGKKLAYMTEETSKKISVCEPFARKKYMLKMEVKRYIKCQIKQIIADFSYLESVSPTNSVESPVKHMAMGYTPGLSFTMTTDTIGDPYAFGSTGIGSASVAFSEVDANPTNSCVNTLISAIVTLDSLGKPVDQWYSDPSPRVHGTNCNEFHPMSSYWTAGNFSHGAIGLVMNFFYNIYAVL